MLNTGIIILAACVICGIGLFIIRQNKKKNEDVSMYVCHYCGEKDCECHRTDKNE